MIKKIPTCLLSILLLFLVNSTTAVEQLNSATIEENVRNVHDHSYPNKRNNEKKYKKNVINAHQRESTDSLNNQIDFRQKKILRGVSFTESVSNNEMHTIEKIKTYDTDHTNNNHNSQVNNQNSDLSPNTETDVQSNSNSIRIPQVESICPLESRYDLNLERSASTFANEKLIDVVISPAGSIPRNLYTIGGEYKNEISIMGINPNDPLDITLISRAEETIAELIRTTSLQDVHLYLETLNAISISLDGEYVITAGTNEGPVSKRGGITIMRRTRVGPDKGKLRVVQQYRLDEAKGLRDISKGMIGINSIAVSNLNGYQQFFVTSGGYGNDFNLMAFVMTDSLPEVRDSYKTQGVSEYIPIFTLTDNIEIYYATESRVLPIQVLTSGGYVYVLGNNPAISKASILVYHQSNMGKLSLIQEIGPLSGTAFVSGIVYSSSEDPQKSYLYASTSYGADDSNILRGYKIDIVNGRLTPIPADQLYPANSPIPTHSQGSYVAKIPIAIQKVKSDDETFDRLIIALEKDDTLHMAIINKENGALCPHNTFDIASYTNRPIAIIAPGEDILADKFLYLGGYIDGNVVTVKLLNRE